MKIEIALYPPDGDVRSEIRLFHLRTEWFMATRPSFKAFLRDLEPGHRIDSDEHEHAFQLFLRRHKDHLLASPGLRPKARRILLELQHLTRKQGWYFPYPPMRRSRPIGLPLSCSTCYHSRVVQHRYQTDGWSCERFRTSMELPAFTWCTDHPAMPWTEDRPIRATELFLTDPDNGSVTIIHREDRLPSPCSTPGELCIANDGSSLICPEHLEYFKIPARESRITWARLNEFFSRFSTVTPGTGNTPMIVRELIRWWSTPDALIRLENDMTRRLATEAMGFLIYNIVRLGDDQARRAALPRLEERLGSGLWDQDVLAHLARRTKALLP